MLWTALTTLLLKRRSIGPETGLDLDTVAADFTGAGRDGKPGPLVCETCQRPLLSKTAGAHHDDGLDTRIGERDHAVHGGLAADGLGHHSAEGMARSPTNYLLCSCQFGRIAGNLTVLASPPFDPGAYELVCPQLQWAHGLLCLLHLFRRRFGSRTETEFLQRLVDRPQGLLPEVGDPQ